MDLLDRLLGHDAWTTRQLLLRCRDLTDEQLDREFDIGHRTVRATLLHVIRNGWLIFDLPEADMGCHPADDGEGHGKPSGTRDISFYCDDIEKTVEELRGRGVEFTGGIEDVGYARATFFKMPGDLSVQLYQPHYTKEA